jgi:hypothetical protein
MEPLRKAQILKLRINKRYFIPQRAITINKTPALSKKTKHKLNIY